LSHTVVIDLVVSDKGALVAACAVLGAEYREGQKTFRRYHGTDRCDAAICVPNNDKAYEIGVRDNNNGSMDLCADFFMGGYGLTQIVGDDASKLKQEYAAQVATNQYEMDGYSISRSVTEDGRIVLEAYR
jgi:hypothetical protein